MKKCSVFVGFDPREVDAFVVACESIRYHSSRKEISVDGLVLADLIHAGLYKRPTEYRDGRIYDLLSRRSDYDGVMSTEFAISRFLIKELARSGLALFMDSDMLVRGNLFEAFEVCQNDPGKAVYCVKHDHNPTSKTKMRGQVQTQYPRKNWSSVFIVDCDHIANKSLTVNLVNELPGRDLHRFAWLVDDEIGELPLEWNWLVGHSHDVHEPSIVHFTDGVPSVEGHQNDPFADEWRDTLNRVAASALGFVRG